MGFFDRLAKSFVGKKQPEVARPAKNGSYASVERFTQQRATRAVPVAANPQHTPAEKTVTVGAMAVTVAEPPETVKSSDGQVKFITFDNDFDQDLNDAFASLVSQVASPEAQSANGEMIAHDQVVVEDLFADIAANYARPIKNFIFEVKRGTATKEWVEICRPAMQGIRRAAAGMGLGPAAQRMVDFETALSLAKGNEDRVLRGEMRDLLLSCYEDLIKVMPQAFLIGEEEQEREGIILNALLKQIPDLGRVTVEKLYRAGLTSLDTFFLAKKDDLAQATGIPSLLSERICEKFQAYRAELEGNSRDLADSGQRIRLSEMLTDLRHQHEGFQRASENAWSNPVLASEKREYRQQRQSCVLRINVLLAEMGELDLVNELQRLSFERRIQRLEDFIASPSPAM